MSDEEDEAVLPGSRLKPSTLLLLVAPPSLSPRPSRSRARTRDEAPHPPPLAMRGAGAGAQPSSASSPVAPPEAALLLAAPPCNPPARSRPRRDSPPPPDFSYPVPAPVEASDRPPKPPRAPCPGCSTLPPSGRPVERMAVAGMALGMEDDDE